MKLKLMTFNIRHPNDPNGHSVAERAPRVLDVIRSYDPDVFGLQEMRPRWEPYLAELDAVYDHVLVYRHPDNLEGTPVFWKKDIYELVEEKHFWLSETPAVPSKGWNADCYRICHYLALRHKETGKIFYYYNTHFDFGDRNHANSAQLIIRRAEAHGNDAPVVCTADFNFPPGSAGWHSMRSWFYDVRECIAPQNKQGTFHGYRGVGEQESRIIDFGFFHGKIKPTHYEVVTRSYEGKFPSDHYPVYFEFEVE